jgi:type VI secretion system protein ImpK
MWSILMEQPPMPDATATPARATFPVLSRFFEFWEEVEELRRQVRVPRQGDETAPPVARAREQLADALRTQRLSAGRSQGSTLQPLDEAQYVMAATADELFINPDWDGAGDWTTRPLEVELFGTRRAGEEIFARIDRLVSGHGPVATEMAAVYLTALELGFKGQYADPDDQPTLDAYEARLRELIGRRPAMTGPLVPECYDHTTVAAPGLRLPGSRVWWSAAVAVVAIFLLALIVTLARFRGSPIEGARQRLETNFGLLAATK